jgi:hypothetical protein
VKFKPGQEVMIRFYDHAHHTGSGPYGLLICIVYGKVLTCDRHCVNVISWLVEDKEAGGAEVFSIALSTILERKVFK